MQEQLDWPFDPKCVTVGRKLIEQIGVSGTVDREDDPVIRPISDAHQLGEDSQVSGVPGAYPIRPGGFFVITQHGEVEVFAVLLAQLRGAVQIRQKPADGRAAEHSALLRALLWVGERCQARLPAAPPAP